jgi:hypothetical protein
MQYNNPMLKNLRWTFLDPLRGITYVVYIILLQYFMLYEQGFWVPIIVLQYCMLYEQYNGVMTPNPYRVAVMVLQDKTEKQNPYRVAVTVL